MIPGNQFLKVIKNVLCLSSTIYEDATKTRVPTFWSCFNGTPPTWYLGARVLMIEESLGCWVEGSTKLDSSETKPNPVDFA